MSEGIDVGKVLKAQCVEPAKSGSAQIEQFYEKYGCLCPQIIMDLYKTFPGGFVERFRNESVLFYDAETLLNHAEELVPIEIPQTGLMPIADFKDNQFLCYRPMKKEFELYHAVDEIAIYTNQSLSALLNELGFSAIES